MLNVYIPTDDSEVVARERNRERQAALVRHVVAELRRLAAETGEPYHDLKPIVTGAGWAYNHGMRVLRNSRCLEVVREVQSRWNKSSLTTNYGRALA